MNPGRVVTLIEDPGAVELLNPPYMERDWRNFARGLLALAEGRFEQAIDLLSTDTMMLFISAPHAHQLAMQSLARAYLGLGQSDKAIDTLESVRQQGPLTIIEPGTTWFWLNNQVLLYQLYRETGNVIKAEGVAADLHETLRLADAGHPFLQALKD